MCNHKPTYGYQDSKRVRELNQRDLTVDQIRPVTLQDTINIPLVIHLHLRKKNMAFLVYYLILHLCFSMHACNSRHLGVFHKEPGKEFSLITSKTQELIAQLEGRLIDEDIIKQKESKLEFSLNAQKTSKAGSEMKVQISQEENEIVEWKNHARSTMESKLQDSNEDINKSKDNNTVTEDVTVMDYAQPHRKPPIHNIAP